MDVAVELLNRNETNSRRTAKVMPVESIVSELMDVIQRHLTESVGEDLSAKEQRALAAGRRFAQTLLEEMLKADAQEPVWTRRRMRSERKEQATREPHNRYSCRGT